MADQEAAHSDSTSNNAQRGYDSDYGAGSESVDLVVGPEDADRSLAETGADLSGGGEKYGGRDSGIGIGGTRHTDSVVAEPPELPASDERD